LEFHHDLLTVPGLRRLSEARLNPESAGGFQKMMSQIQKWLSINQVPAFSQFLWLGLALLWCSGSLLADDQHAPGLAVHEWGTFTAIAGLDGQAVTWIPFQGSFDLPGFVERLHTATPKSSLRGTIRMETPVMYFYSPRELTVSVRVAFSRGVITEWYPHATRIEPQGPVPGSDLGNLNSDGTIGWDEVEITPNLSGDLLREPKQNHYYYARDTSSSPVRVNTSAGEQREKFLFYRGASAAALPLVAKLEPAGKVHVKNLSEEQIPAMIFFERRGERLGYRFLRDMENDAVLDAPELTGNVDTMTSDLEAVLVDEGLYRDEAHAMIETWQNSWREEGSRLIYIVPRGFVDKVLPLTISPAPEQLLRVFVGRLEIVTPETASAVENAFATHDGRTLNKYSRFLGAILDIAKQQRKEVVR
jgi:hypothetical protein